MLVKIGSDNGLLVDVTKCDIIWNNDGSLTIRYLETYFSKIKSK